MMFHTCFNINTELFRAMMDFDDVIRCGPSFRRMEVFLRIYLLNNSEGFHEFMATTKNQPVIYIYIYTHIYIIHIYSIYIHMYIYILVWDLIEALSTQGLCCLPATFSRPA
jgi:hypothetical protein